MPTVRLDKILAAQSMTSRKDIKALIRSGTVKVNSIVAKNADMQIDCDIDEVFVKGEKISLDEKIYIMMNKPSGVVSATEDTKFPTVVDILPESLKRKGLFPAGRLDKDTLGFVLITNDGEFAHNILSPKKHVEKTYIAKLDKKIEEDIVCEFLKGVDIGGGDICLPAKLNIIENSDIPIVEVKIKQGMYHQIKRMFLSYGYKVIYLKRTQIGQLILDNNLSEGEARQITKDELAKVTKIINDN
ncbi:MAG: pseudouridine synthase [Oscillospiraceae bacterium]